MESVYIWPYDEYSNWARGLAKNYTRVELEKKLAKIENFRVKATTAHLRAIERTSSMQSNSQSRAQTGNVVRGNYEERTALKDALEIHSIYPEYSKPNN